MAIYVVAIILIAFPVADMLHKGFVCVSVTNMSQIVVLWETWAPKGFWQERILAFVTVSPC